MAGISSNQGLVVVWFYECIWTLAYMSVSSGYYIGKIYTSDSFIYSAKGFELKSCSFYYKEAFLALIYGK